MTTARQAVILCGGLGTRLYPHTLDLPKPMISTNGRPFLTYLIEQLRDQGTQKVLLLTGYRGEQILNFFGDGQALGIEITYSHGPVEWETARRLWEARALLDQRFMLLYADNFVPLSLQKLWALHEKERRPVTVSLCKKAKGNIRLGKNGSIEAYDSTRLERGLEYVEVGYMAVERDQTLGAIKAPDVSFSVVLQELAAAGRLTGNVLADRYQSISDPDRWHLAQQYLSPKRILLLDRDGTLNERPPQGRYVSSWPAFQWLPKAREGLKVLARKGFRFALITNQAGIARGLITQAAVDEIHSNIRTELAADGVEITHIYVCPHHWDQSCTCRKPAPGMLLQASRDLDLRLDRAVYIGDDARDCQAANAAQCASAFVGDSAELLELPPSSQPQIIGASLLDIVPGVIGMYERWENQELPLTG